MKRRLTKAYDTMTMPDRCSHRIEGKLPEGLQQQKTGQYAKAIAPSPVCRRSWLVGVAAVCLMLILSVGGTMLLTRVSESEMERPEGIKVWFEKTTVTPTPEDHYAMVTDFSVEEVESFAASVRQNVLDGDWEEFAKKVNYPVSIYDRRIGNEGGLVGLTLRNKVKVDFIEQIEKESCRKMFCNWQGICMADGRIWINDVDGQLKIMAINDMFGELVDYTDFRYGTAEDGHFAISAYTGGAEAVILPSVYEQKLITQVGLGEPVIRNGDAVKEIRIPDSVTLVRENAFADCTALERVFFQGDAPPENEDVFSGSDNVTVYYKPGSKGWGDTWCGRKTLQYDEGYLSLGTVRMQEQNQDYATALFADVLKEKKAFFCELTTNSITIAEYCELRSKETGKAVTVPSFTMVDMDRDGVKELILQVSIEGDIREDYLILRYDPYDDKEGGMVYAFMEPQQKMMDLKKDGSFYWREGGPGQESRVVLDPDRGGGLVVSSLGEGNNVDPLWHAWPCVRPEVILKSYEYAGTGETVFPGIAWYVFEGIANGTRDNSWKLWWEQLSRWGAICLEENGEVSVYDPDAPGCRMFGTLDEKGQFTSIGYYISNEFGEREAEIRDLLSENPQYIVGSYLEDLDAHGIEVARLKELLDYLS